MKDVDLRSKADQDFDVSHQRLNSTEKCDFHITLHRLDIDRQTRSYARVLTVQVLLQKIVKPVYKFARFEPRDDSNNTFISNF